MSRPKPKSGRAIVREMMHEVILYGGLPARRCDVYDHALATLRTHIGRNNGPGRKVTDSDARRGAELFAFGFNTRLAPPGTVPFTREQLDDCDGCRLPKGLCDCATAPCICGSDEHASGACL